MVSTAVVPLRRRPFDVLLVVWAVIFAWVSFFIDSLLAFNVPLSAQSESLVARTFYQVYAGDADPLLVENPLFLRAQALICVFVFGPFYLVLAYALWQGRNWIRLPGLLYSAVALYCIAIVLGVNFLGGYTTGSPFKFLAANLPYVIYPILVAYRLHHSFPFGPQGVISAGHGRAVKQRQTGSVEIPR